MIWQTGDQVKQDPDFCDIPSLQGMIERRSGIVVHVEVLDPDTCSYPIPASIQIQLDGSNNAIVSGNQSNLQAWGWQKEACP